ATPRLRAPASAWPARSRTSPQAAGRRSSCWRARCCPAWRRSMTPRGDRRPYIAGNWKMHKTIAETREYVEHLLPRLPVRGGVDVGVCVPFTALAAAVEAAGDSQLAVSAHKL